MSSLTEGMPLVLREALLWRVPIRATSVALGSGAVSTDQLAHATGGPLGRSAAGVALLRCLLCAGVSEPL